MTTHIYNPALEAELAYRRERLQASRYPRNGRRHWFASLRRAGS
jgi:hypothetical protein